MEEEFARLFPEGPMAYSRLAMFLARHQRPREAVEVVRRLVENRPDPAGYAAAVRTLAGLGDPRAARGLLAEARRRFPENDELAALADRAANEAGG